MKNRREGAIIFAVNSEMFRLHALKRFIALFIRTHNEIYTLLVLGMSGWFDLIQAKKNLLKSNSLI